MVRGVGALLIAYAPALLTAAALGYIEPWEAGGIMVVSLFFGIILVEKDR